MCAGDEVMATRFALADGSNTWARPVDATPDDIGSSSSNGGTIIGAHADRVYVYGSDDRSLADGMTTPTRYTIRSLDAETGKAIWTTATGDSEEATELSSDQGDSIAVTEGGIATYGKRGEQYAQARRRRHHRHERDTPRPHHRRARWTVQVKGEQHIVGQTDGRLILLGTGGTHCTMTLLNVRLRRRPRGRPADRQTALGEQLHRGAFGPPTASATHLYLASPNGRLAALDVRTGA
ncbi:PQQ-binding-like beta-propeller repeat protein [Streptomyces sp. NPDC056462]|uniref:outer membrane protein assembly factor BamB family protein n=1 Tax=Streptomyces sp. NPDC056462 TaxID=3345826 RepID=UPI0036C2FED6